MNDLPQPVSELAGVMAAMPIVFVQKDTSFSYSVNAVREEGCLVCGRR